MPDRTPDKHAGAREELERSVLTGEASVPAEARALAFARPGALDGAIGAYCTKVAADATTVTDDDVAALHAGGLDDARIFEFTVAAAVGQASRQLNSALSALAAAREPA